MSGSLHSRCPNHTSSPRRKYHHQTSRTSRCTSCCYTGQPHIPHTHIGRSRRHGSPRGNRCSYSDQCRSRTCPHYTEGRTPSHCCSRSARARSRCMPFEPLHPRTSRYRTICMHSPSCWLGTGRPRRPGRKYRHRRRLRNSRTGTRGSWSERMRVRICRPHRRCTSSISGRRRRLFEVMCG